MIFKVKTKIKMDSILLIGDPHFKVSNPLESQQLHDEVIRIIKERNDEIDFIVVLGDILDTHEKVHIQPLCRSINFLRIISQLKKTYVLIGNHDRINNNVYLTEQHAFLSLKNQSDDLIIVDETVSDGRFCFVPYVPNGRFIEATGDHFDGKDCFFAHQEFKGCKMGGIISENGDEWDENFPPVFSGHIHDYQQPQKNIIYTGTPFQHSFGDEEDKGIFLLKFENPRNWDLEKIELNIVKKKYISMNISEFEDYQIPRNCLLKINFIGESSVIKQQLTRKDISDKIKKNNIKYKMVHKKNKKLIANKSNNFLENLNSRINNSEKDIKLLYEEIFL